MPSHKEVKEFAELIAKHTGYKVSNEHEKSRIVLLSRDDDAEKNAKINFKALYGYSSDKTYK
jgi:wyosine [tRNA(Phe)-imidazoG37] synthetase (radical SAM superfamily)